MSLWRHLSDGCLAVAFLTGADSADAKTDSPFWTVRDGADHRQSHIGKPDKALDEATRRGRIVADWKNIFAFEDRGWEAHVRIF